MPKQPAIPGLRDAIKTKVTRREQFLAEMDAVVPFARLDRTAQPEDWAERRAAADVLGTMMHIYFLRNSYALSDPMGLNNRTVDPSIIAYSKSGVPLIS